MLYKETGMSIQIKNITKSFPRDEGSEHYAILKNLSLEIPSREFISFVGTSGYIKSVYGVGYLFEEE